jgi:hypothetical protein
LDNVARETPKTVKVAAKVAHRPKIGAVDNDSEREGNETQ